MVQIAAYVYSGASVHVGKLATTQVLSSFAIERARKACNHALASQHVERMRLAVHSKAALQMPHTEIISHLHGMIGAVWVLQACLPR